MQRYGCICGKLKGTTIHLKVPMNVQKGTECCANEMNGRVKLKLEWRSQLSSMCEKRWGRRHLKKKN